MRKNLFLMMACAGVVLTSCTSKLGELSADYFTVTPNPLEANAGQVPATIAGTFPEKYMKKKAVVTVTPELRYGNGQAKAGTPATFQGEKVVGNDQVIQYKVGGRYTMRSNWAYEDAMQKSDLYLTFQAKVGKKTVTIPDVKVAEGIIATSELYKATVLSDGGIASTDAYQRITADKQEAVIKFLVNKADIRQSELESNSVQDFVRMLQQINAEQERLALQNVEIAAFASPEGALDFNTRLAGKRQESAEGYVNEQLSALNLDTEIDAHYTAEDWEGFQQLVAVSNIQDKDVILRVLSMYKDPEERERQIRNMSEGFRELADGILPELRRSRMIINYQVIGRSDSQILDQFKSDASQLSIEELLYGATLVNDVDTKTAIYKKAAELYPNEARAYNNLATMALLKGDKAAAKTYLDKAIKANPNNCEALNNRGLLNLVEGNIAAAEADIAKASSYGDVSYAQGVLNIAKGNYSAAEAAFKNSNSNSAALAQILNKNYTKAVSTLNDAANKDAMNAYLLAIAAARRGNQNAAETYLKEAIAKDPSLKKYAENDLEFNK